MRQRALVSFLVVFFGPLSGCLLTRTAFEVPASVWAGHVFEIVVEGQYPYTSGAWNACCVLQVPVGFTVLGAANSMAVTMTRDEPSLLATYTAEPGSQLASWSGFSIQSGPATVRLRVRLRAPQVLGTFTCKVSLARGNAPYFTPMDPPGVAGFAQVLGGAARTFVVDDAPAQDFGPDDEGLPIGLQSWSGIAAGDLDGDGDDDLAMISDATGPLTFLSDPGGPWTAHASGWPAASLRGRVAFGDFDGDGMLDLADGNGRVLFGAPGGFVPGPTFPLLGLTSATAVGDIDNDGIDDLAFGSDQQFFVQVFRSNGNRTFTPASTGLPASTASGQWAYTLKLQDVTGDGFCDVVWTHATMGNVWAGNGGTAWTPGSIFGGQQYTGVAIGDVDGDGLPEIVCGEAVPAAGGVRVFKHMGNNFWSPMPTGLPVLGYAHSVALLDYDRDGDLDLVAGTQTGYGNYAPQRLELWQNLGAAQFAPVTGSGLPPLCTSRVTDLVVGDFNADSFPDLAATVAYDGVFVFQNLRAGLSRYGTDCAAGAIPAPALTANSAPVRGNPGFAFVLANGAPSGAGFFVIGTSRTLWAGQPLLPLDLTLLGAPGCSLLAEPLASNAIVFGGLGTATVPLPIPALPSLVRLTYFAQCAAARPGANALGLLFSDGLAVRIE
ncbi:MAG: VCBS repeat-containing protein [Planctomycetota bacterium]